MNEWTELVRKYNKNLSIFKHFQLKKKKSNYQDLVNWAQVPDDDRRKL